MDFSYLWTSFSIATLIAILGLGLIGYRMSISKNKKDKRKLLGLFGTVAIGLAILPAFVSIPTLTNPLTSESFATGVGDVPTQSAGVDGLCAVEDTTVTLSGIDTYLSTPSGGNHRYKINGAPALTVSDAGTFTASPGDRLEILWMNGSETASAYFSDISTETIPCKGTVTLSKELVRNSTVTIDVFNEDGNKITSDGANNETLAAGDVTTLVARIKGDYQKGQKYGGVVVCEYNSTNTDDCIVDFGGVEVDVPQIYALSSGRKAKAYEIPSFLGTEQLDGTVTIDVDDTNDPLPDTMGALNLTYYPYDYFVNEAGGGIYDGPAAEDENDVQTKIYSANTDIFVA